MTKQFGENALLKKEIDALVAKSTTDNINIHYLSHLVAKMNPDLTYTHDQLSQILGSSRWALGGIFSSFLKKIRLQTFMNKAYRRIKKVTSQKAQQPMIETLAELPPKHDIPVIYDIYPYKNLQLLKDIEVLVVEDEFTPDYYKVLFSIATPVWNEEDGIIAFLESIQAQTLKPDEVILTDGESTDNTVRFIEKFAAHADFDITVIREKRIPIATGRNLAIKKARNEIIVMADAGTVLDKNYCLNLVSCFKKYGNPELVGGIWLPITASENTAAFIPNWNTMDWKQWLTSTRTMAIRKSLIKKAGYFPEHIFYGDDTLFGVKYRRISKKWVFNKKAVTYWDAPVSKEQYIKTSRNYGKGDGENGLGEYFYSSNLLHATKTDFPAILPVRKEFLDGFLEGRMNRGKIEIDLRNIKGVVVYLTDIPFYENEHSSVYKSVLKMLAANYKVICVNFYPNLDQIIPKKYLDIDYTLLELYYADDFDSEELLVRYPLAKITIKIIPENRNPKYDHLLAQLKSQKIRVITPLHS